VAEAPGFTGLAALRPGVARWTDGDGGERLIVEIVTGDYFDVLGVRLPLGRGFLPEETRPGQAEQVVVLAHEFWRDRLAADPGVLGRTVRLNGRDFTAVGVAPEGLIGRFLRLKVDAWVPVGLPGGFYHSTPQELGDRRDREYSVYGRLAPGISLAQAQAQVAVVADRLRAEHPDAWVGHGGESRVFTLLPEEESRIPPSARAALAGLVGFLLAGALGILLIACTNVAGLFLARAARRGREVAVRLSLGASRGRLVRLLLVEASLVALVGGLLGVWLASRSAGFLGSIPFPLDVPLSFAVGVDARVLVFALGASVLACLTFGLVPALQATRPDLVRALRDEGGWGRRRRMSLRATLVLPDPVAADPEVAAVSVASVPELSLWVGGARARVEVEGYTAAPEEDMVMGYNAVTPEYFEMVGLRPLSGRSFGSGDGPGSPHVAIVNETFASRHWPRGSALGGRFTVVERRTFDSPYPSEPTTFEVVGVLPDVRATPDQRAEPFFWTSYLQDVTPLAVIHAQARFDAADVVPVLRREVVANDDDLQLVSPQTYDDLLAFTLLPVRLASLAFAYAGLFALLLAVMGIYGIVSFAVSQRSREMAIRQAIGAARGHVFRAVLADGMRLTGLGLALGLAVALAGAYLARSTLMGVSPLDPAAVLGGAGVILTAAFVATWVPARRVTRADPMGFLRKE
jgi:hypothetical protein